MRRESFTEQRTGDLVEITSPYRELAFIPHPLPPSWTFPQELWPLLSEAKQILGTLNGIGRTLPNPDLLLRPLQQREALRSSSLEGTYATPQELLLFEISPKTPTSAHDRANSWQEVSNYGRALEEGYHYLLETPSSMMLVRALHNWLMTGVRGEEKSPGQFRNCQVHIGSERRYVPPPPEHLDACLDALGPHIKQRDESIDALVGCYLIHYQFEAIHPFKDGNGRVGRLLLALMTWQRCGLSRPWLYMSAYFEQHKDEYIGKMFDISVRGAWSEWIEFCLRGTIEQAEDAIRRCDRLGQLRVEFLQRVTEGSVRLHQIIESLFERPVLTVPSVRDRHNVTYPTAQSDIERLVEASILSKVEGKRRPTTYYAPAIFDIAYGEP